MKALYIAKYFLFLARKENAGEVISNLKMQKLLWYAQGHHLSKYNKALFSDRIEAWWQGPVVKNVYIEFRKYENNSISFDELNDFDTDLIAKDKEVLDTAKYVYARYMSYTALQLRNKTHNETPYINNYDEGLTNLISNEDIKKYFNELKQLEEEKNKKINKVLSEILGE